MKSPSQWVETLTAQGVRAETAVKWADAFSVEVTPAAFSKGAEEISEFVANFLHECGRLEAMEESLNYKAEALLKLFGRHRISEADCWKYGRTPTQKANQPMIANLLYGGAWGAKNLGNTEPGDGWKYRARGAGLTGRHNYKKAGEALGIDLENNPELAAQQEWAIKAFIHFWESNVPDAVMDDIRAVRKAVNGGNLGLDDVATIDAEMEKSGFA